MPSGTQPDNCVFYLDGTVSNLENKMVWPSTSKRGYVDMYKLPRVYSQTDAYVAVTEGDDMGNMKEPETDVAEDTIDYLSDLFNDITEAIFNTRRGCPHVDMVPSVDPAMMSQSQSLYIDELVDFFSGRVTLQASMNKSQKNVLF